jgi:REP element-mobilizing transposase RayT
MEYSVSYWRLYYHFVWATKKRLPLITLEVETILFGYLIGKAHDMRAIVHAVGGIEDHVHLVTSVRPSVALSDFAARLKGSSSHHLNEILKDAFAWQAGYGVVSFGEKQLEWVVRYVNNQKQHHAELTTAAKLEEVAVDSDGPAPTVAWNL